VDDPDTKFSGVFCPAPGYDIVFVMQIIRGAAIGDRGMVIDNSIGLGFLTGYESKVRMLVR